MTKNKEVIKAEPAPESANTKPEFTCIRKGSAPKLRDSTQQIYYAVGKNLDMDVLQLVSNTNNGLFSDELIPIQSIQDCLSTQDKQASFSSRIFNSLYKQKSNNNAGFLAAVLREEDILEVADKKLFMHQLAINVEDIFTHLIGTNTDEKSGDKSKSSK